MVILLTDAGLMAPLRDTCTAFINFVFPAIFPNNRMGNHSPLRIKTNLYRYIDLDRFSVSMKDTSLQESAVQFHRHPHVIPSIDHAVELEGKKRRWNSYNFVYLC